MLTLLNLKEVLKATGLSRVHIWGRIKAGRFPASMKVPGDTKHLYFRQDQVNTWIANHAAWKKGCASRSRSRGGMGTGPEADGDAKDKRDMLSLQARVSSALAQLARTDAEIVKLKGLLSALSGRVAALENQESPVDRTARGLAEMAGKVDAATPGRVPGYESDKLELRKRESK